MDIANLEIVVGALAGENIDQWGLVLDDVRDAIAFGEETGAGCVDGEGRRLVRNVTEYTNVYAEYRIEGDRVDLSNVYAHRLKLNSEAGLPTGTTNGEPEGRWKCNRCDADMEKIEDLGLHFEDVDLGSIEGLRCPSCGYEVIEHNFVQERMYMSEMMLETK